MPAQLTMDTLVSLLKRRGFVFQASEIYGGINGFYDYGPLGVELRQNIKNVWWKDMVQRRDDMVGVDSTIIQSTKVWKASGHLDNFTDPLVDCKESKMRYRADQLFFSPVSVAGKIIGYVSALECADIEEVLLKAAQEFKRKAAVQGEIDPLQVKDFTEATEEEIALVPSPATGKPGSLTPPRAFNMMFQTYIGALADESSKSYLRPETAQGIFTNFKNVVDSSRVKIPFGIAQIGKAFRNEITPRNFVFRSREFEQMEIEYFIAGDDEEWPKVHREWIDECINWLVSIGIPRDLLGEDVHPKEKLSHYSRATTDITFDFPFGRQELWGIAARGNFDLTQHQEHSGKSQEYFDEARKERYIPHVIEPSVGVDRTMLAVLCAAYDEDEIEGEKRTLLRFSPKVAPIKAAVFPLVKNKPELVELTKSLYKKLQRRWNVFYDQSGAIGRRYRRMDEVGTPYCITVDFDSLENGTFTVRDRDTTEQVRMTEQEILNYLDEKIEG
ncbi:MAG: glycine--tRNA ligase [Opitutales bacterium]|nr:glycine--tRNA ligase [Opitutales bacterium]